MIRKVVQYGHPVLRKKGEQVETITPAILSLIQDLLDTMRDARGIGLAAQQIGVAMQITVVDVGRVENRQSTLELKGKPASVDQFMPVVLINPGVNPISKATVELEGCLSFPDIFADISRPETVEVVAMNEKGENVEFCCGGLLARAIQHEVDHLNGILFIDRMSLASKDELRSKFTALALRTKKELEVPRQVNS